jgi:hypothetical protein
MKNVALSAGLLVALAAFPAVAQPGGLSRAPAQALTRAAVEARVQAQFGRADADRDGFITQTEAQARVDAARASRAEHRAERQAQRGEHRARLFTQLDANRDGVISRAEFESRPNFRADRMGRRGFRAERRGQRGGFAGFGQRRFEAADANRDGRISLAEAQAQALARFERLDANRDGRVTPDERMRAREERRAQRSRG